MDEAAVQASGSDAAQFSQVLGTWMRQSIDGVRQRRLSDFLAFYDMRDLHRHVITTEKDLCA
ncbi:hypothetical protein [Elioraea sp.]|uniref:hypothetical protein n=1 Tax=Elioraea sp. TaxID=2185103 RepID=UPI0025C1277C|nr:hypothetical protein [Elioraea sp.]